MRRPFGRYAQGLLKATASGLETFSGTDKVGKHGRAARTPSEACGLPLLRPLPPHYVGCWQYVNCPNQVQSDQSHLFPPKYNTSFKSSKSYSESAHIAGAPTLALRFAPSGAHPCPRHRAGCASRARARLSVDLLVVASRHRDVAPCVCAARNRAVTLRARVGDTGLTDLALRGRAPWQEGMPAVNETGPLRAPSTLGRLVDAQATRSTRRRTISGDQVAARRGSNPRSLSSVAISRKDRR